MISAPLDEELQSIFGKLGITSCSPNVLTVLRQAHKAAEVSDVTVLIRGETGTGKQLLAQGIHALDEKRKGHPFVSVHCSTISETLAESELFGHRRGAFSGAVGDRKGLFMAADHGTILLDDVNDLPAALQPKLLDVIQRGIVRPVGADREITIDVRIIAACNRPLEPLVREGRFRSDLFHRLNVVNFCLPPLRERAADLAACYWYWRRGTGGCTSRSTDRPRTGCADPVESFSGQCARVGECGAADVVPQKRRHFIGSGGLDSAIRAENPSAIAICWPKRPTPYGRRSRKEASHAAGLGSRETGAGSGYSGGGYAQGDRETAAYE